MSNLTANEYSLAEISERTYDDLELEIEIEYYHKIETWEIIEPIVDKDTGLHGYVLKKQDTDNIVISFRGTEVNSGFVEGYKDIKEDALGIVLGDSNYT